MKKDAFEKYLDYAIIDYNHVRYTTRITYKLYLWNKYNAFFSVYCIGFRKNDDYKTILEMMQEYLNRKKS